MSGKSSISSSELYGDQTTAGASYNAGPDMSAIKDGMKDSVTQVAGRLSRMANGIVNTIQVPGVFNLVYLLQCSCFLTLLLSDHLICFEW